MAKDIKEYYKQHFVLIAVLFLGSLTFLLYLPVSRFEFIHLDDYSYVVTNPLVRYGIIPGHFVSAFGVYFSSNWHPITWISHMLDCQLFGLNAGAHHLVNVLIHTANSILLFVVLRRLTGAVWKSLLVAALFAWHPLHVESVAWISERKDLLCALFWLLTLWAYARYGGRKNNNGFYLLSLLFGVLAMMAKPMAVTLPFVLLLLDVWPLERLSAPAENPLAKRIRLLLIEKLPLFLFSAFVCFQTVKAQSVNGNVKSLEYLPLFPRLTNTLIAYAAYLRMMVWPADLAIVYPHPHQLRLGVAFVSTAVLLTLSAWVIVMRKKQPYLLFGWLWYLGTLVPVIGLIQVGSQSMADRYTYIPLIGIFIMIVWLTGDVLKHRPSLKSAVVGLSCIALIACLVLTRIQIFRWKDSKTLFTHTLSVTQNNWLAETALGISLYDTQMFDESAKHLQKAVELRSDDPFLRVNLGRIYLRQNKTDKALLEYQQALQIDPKYVDAYYVLGQLYQQEDKPQLALAQYQKAAAISPELHMPITQMVWILSTHPDAEIRNGDQAVRLAEEFLDLPCRKDPVYLCALSAAYAETGRFDNALNTAEKALKQAQRLNTQNIADKIKDCMTCYKKHLPYRDDPCMPLSE